LNEVETAAQAQLREIVRDLTAIQFRLLGVQASLPPAPEEIVRQLDVEAMETSTEIRTIVQCVLEDFLGPAIRDLGNAAALPEKR